MNCAKCGHSILDHSSAAGISGMRAPCYNVWQTPNAGIPMWCPCSDFVMPGRPLPAKLCVCGHPATSHSPVYRYDGSGILGPFRLVGVCKEAHPNGPYPCWGFTAPEDVKQKTATEVLADQPVKRWEDDLPAVHRRLAAEQERANKAEKTIHRILDFIQDKD